MSKADDDRPDGQEYGGPSGIARDSMWLTSEDLVEGKDTPPLTVAKVWHYPKVKFEKGRTEENMIGLEFSGRKRILLLNATNRKAMNKKFGNITSAWKGKQITLYVADTEFGGEARKGVRIRGGRAPAATAAEDIIHEREAQPLPETEEQAKERVSSEVLALGLPLDKSSEEFDRRMAAAGFGPAASAK